jgi:hypothetical protein
MEEEGVALRRAAKQMRNHVVHQEPDTTAIDAIRHPIPSDRSLLMTVNQNLHLPKAHNHFLLQHRATNCVLLTGAATIAHQRADNFNDDAGGVSGHSGLMRAIGHGQVLFCLR